MYKGLVVYRGIYVVCKENTEQVNVKNATGISEKDGGCKRHGNYLVCTQMIITFCVNTATGSWTEFNKEEQRADC